MLLLIVQFAAVFNQVFVLIPRECLEKLVLPERLDLKESR